MKVIKFWFALILFCSLALPLKATHNRAGEITYEQIGVNSIRMTLTTYTKTSSTAADRDSVEIFWGDGTKETIQRSNGRGIPLPNDVKLNKYIQEHTYPGRGTYTISFRDQNRIGNILNVNYPNSIDVALALTTTFTLLDPQFQGVNNSVILLQPPVDYACLNKRFIHNPNAYDPDGDSLSYELVVPMQSVGESVPGYLFPDQILPGPGNSIRLDPITGDFIWQSPPQQGEYNIAIRINEYRKGVLITSVIRDMQILVRACMNEPPVIDLEDEICVQAGEKISLPIGVSDPDLNQKIELTASGAPFIDGGKAVLIGGGNYKSQPYSALFEWQTDCNDISKNYYKIVFRGADNYFDDSTGLSTLKTLLIKVVGPPPKDPQIANQAGSALLSWEMPYICEDARDEYFLGFSIWRSNKSVNLAIDSCNGGVTGYEKIVFNTKQSDNGRYFYLDSEIDPNGIYCYRIVAEFAKYTSNGNAYNIVESLPSEEVCFTLSRNLPLITKVSVLKTDQAGSVQIDFTKPNIISLDTVSNPGPYKVEYYRKSNLDLNFILLPNATKTFGSISLLLDTIYTDTNINTISSSFDYQLKFYSGDKLIGTTVASSTVFLIVTPSSMRNGLFWNSTTAWTNNKYLIFRKGPQNVDFILIDSTNRTNFTDFDLINGQNYCYKIQSFGTYGLESITDPIVNFSQESCGVPIDNLPPCAPVLQVSNLCDQLGSISLPELQNNLTWSDPNLLCTEMEDIAKYNIYYAADTASSLILIGTVNASDERKFVHENISNGLQGCYVVTAIDLIGNESVYSNRVCVENCPLYELPNTFTPNGDGFNDMYKPSKNFFIPKVEMKIFNEWGNLVFETQDPQINWTGKDFPTGTYYYTCIVYNEDLGGQQTKSGPILRGFINLLR